MNKPAPPKTKLANGDAPEMRLTPPTLRRGGRDVINVDGYVPYFVNAINNPLSRGASQLYLRDFGVGIVEWRIISMLAIEERIPASRIVDVVQVDKSATSRGLRDLEEKGLARFEANKADARRRIWWLSKAGYDIHDRIITVALERERLLLQGVDAADLEITLRVMRQMNRNARKLSSGDGGA